MLQQVWTQPGSSAHTSFSFWTPRLVPLVITHHSGDPFSRTRTMCPSSLFSLIGQNYASHPWPNPSLVLDQLTFMPGSGSKDAFPEGPAPWRTADPDG